MPSILLEVQETVMKYADIMSKVAQVEVEVVDENLFRVAGTGIFEQHVNEDMAQEGMSMSICFVPAMWKLYIIRAKKDFARNVLKWISAMKR